MRLAALAPLLVGLAACTSFNGLSAEAIPDAQPGASIEAVGEQEPSSNVDSSVSPTEPGTPDEPVANPSAPSCAQKHGGMTCGPDGKSDCCAIAAQGDAKVGKYLITAGRMRTFINEVNGDVAGFVAGLPEDQWKTSWSSGLPTDRASADAALGPQGKKACEQGQFTGHTFWTPPTDADFSDYDQATLDEKALNCVPWSLAQALCAFDGGHLATLADLRGAYTNGGTTKFPWGNDGVDANKPDPGGRVNFEFGFVTEKTPAKFRGDGHPSEVSFFIAPPGRFPAGDNQAGIADAAGNLLEWVSDSPRQFVWKGDFEHHAANAVTFSGNIWMDKEPVVGRHWTWGNNQLFGNAGSAGQKDGYYAIGGRCAF